MSQPASLPQFFTATDRPAAVMSKGPGAEGSLVGLSVGRPRFTDTFLAQIAHEQGLAAAWMAAFSRLGSVAPAGVEGDFAVGVTLPDGQTFLAVDRFAVRSLCWRVIGGRLHFAERADELAALAPVAGIDPQALFDYLYFHVVPSPRTVFEGVHRLPPGHCAVFDKRADAGGALLGAAFRGTRQRQLRRSGGRVSCAPAGGGGGAARRGKPGCFLSGGTDSSTVAGMIGRAAGRPTRGWC